MDALCLSVLGMNMNETLLLAFLFGSLTFCYVCSFLENNRFRVVCVGCGILS